MLTDRLHAADHTLRTGPHENQLHKKDGHIVVARACNFYEGQTVQTSCELTQQINHGAPCVHCAAQGVW